MIVFFINYSITFSAFSISFSSSFTVSASSLLTRNSAFPILALKAKLNFPPSKLCILSPGTKYWIPASSNTAIRVTSD